MCLPVGVMQVLVLVAVFATRWRKLTLKRGGNVQKNSASLVVRSHSLLSLLQREPFSIYLLTYAWFPPFRCRAAVAVSPFRCAVVPFRCTVAVVPLPLRVRTELLETSFR